MEFYQIFGERNSGTNYLRQVMDVNFYLKATQVFGFKHWFIKDHQPRGPSNKTTDHECLKGLEDPQSRNTLFIFAVREPFGWLKSMHRSPYSAPKHMNIPFSNFIRKTWISYEPRIPLDHGPESASPWEMEHNLCWIESATNICQLRNLKNRHFLALESKVDFFAIVRQEHLKEDLKALADRFGLEQIYPDIVLPNYRNPRNGPLLNLEDRSFIASQLNPEIEKRFGYKIS